MVAYLTSGIGLRLLHEVHEIGRAQFPQVLKRFRASIDGGEDIVILDYPGEVTPISVRAPRGNVDATTSSLK